jgi:hypothetical protein
LDTSRPFSVAIEDIPPPAPLDDENGGTGSSGGDSTGTVTDAVASIVGDGDNGGVEVPVGGLPPPPPVPSNPDNSDSESSDGELDL